MNLKIGIKDIFDVVLKREEDGHQTLVIFYEGGTIEILLTPSMNDLVDLMSLEQTLREKVADAFINVSTSDYLRRKHETGKP